MSQVPTQHTPTLKNAEFDQAIVELKSLIRERKTDVGSIIRMIYFMTVLIERMSIRNHTVEELRAELKNTVGQGKGKHDEEMFNPNIIFLANCVIDGKIDRKTISEILRAKTTLL